MVDVTSLNQAGSMVADVPMNGIVFPPFSSFTSPRYVPAEPSASVKITSGWKASMEVTSVRKDDAPRWIGKFLTVMQNIGMCARSTIGATAEASSDVQPTTAIRFELLATIWLAAGVASAGSPRVSNFWQLTLRPPTPPWLLISGCAARQAA